MAAEILSKSLQWDGSGPHRAQRGLTAGGVAHVKLIGADGVAFRADAKQFALQRRRCGARVEFRCDLIQRFQQALAAGLKRSTVMAFMPSESDVHHRRRTEAQHQSMPRDAAAGYGDRSRTGEFSRLDERELKPSAFSG